MTEPWIVEELATTTEHTTPPAVDHCHAALDYDGHTIAVCALSANHTTDHHDVAEDDHGQTFTITWKRTPDTVIGQVIE